MLNIKDYEDQIIAMHKRGIIHQSFQVENI